METKELSEDEQRSILNRESPWIPLDGPLVGQGGGARVFKVVRRESLYELEAQLRGVQLTAEAEARRKAIAELLHSCINVIGGNKVAIGAGKVAKKPDHRLKREIDVLRDVQHPNLIRMLDQDKAAEPRWYVMPVMKGGTLKGRSDLVGNARGVVRGMLQIARALAELHRHENPITHRDIKPGNIFVSDDNDWILGDPGVAHRDDGGEETVTRPVSKDWAPRWYGDKFVQLPKADLYMLGATALSTLVGGDKALDPTYLDEDEFKLPRRFPEVPGITELHAVICKLFVAKAASLPFEDAAALIPELEKLVPIVANDEAWQLRQELARLRREPEVLVSFVNSNHSFYSGDLPGLQRMLVRIPPDCVRLLCWYRAENRPACKLVLFDEGYHQLKAEVPLNQDSWTTIDVPNDVRGQFARITVVGQSGLIHSAFIYAERG